MLEKPNKSNEPEIFDQDIRQFVKEFKECVAKSGEDVCTTRKTWFELTGGLYYFSVKRWLDLFPRESFMFIHLSDFTDPTTFHKKIKEAQEFLGIKVENLEVRTQNTASGRPKMLESTRQFLADFYRPYNKQFYDLLGVDYHWDSP